MSHPPHRRTSDSPSNSDGTPGLRFSAQAVNLLVVILGIAAAYFMTIQSLKVELAAKAENAVVETLDRKLTAFEVILREGVVDKEEFYRFSCGIESRLIRIEQYLIENSGDSLGHK
jgi:hypothetical protein